MFGAILLLVGTFFDEGAGTLSKRLLTKQKFSAFSLSFLNHIGFVAFFALQIAVLPATFTFQTASLPFIVLRVVLETLQAWLTMEGLKRASRSTFGFLRVLTIPLLIISDVFLLQSPLAPLQYAGITIIVAALLWLFRENGSDRKGAGIVLLGALNAAFTLTLFKYDIEHFNSVAAEQLIVGLCMMLVLFCIERFWFGRNPFSVIKNRTLFFEAGSLAVGAVFVTYGYAFLAVSIATAMKRALAVLWGVLFGHQFFKEKHFVQKLAGCAALGAGLILMLK